VKKGEISPIVGIRKGTYGDQTWDSALEAFVAFFRGSRMSAADFGSGGASPGDRRPVRVGRPPALFQPCANLLPASGTGVQRPLSPIHIGEKQPVCLLAE